MAKSRAVPPYTAFGLEQRHLVEAYELYCRGALLREVGIFLGKYATRRITQREVRAFFACQGWELFQAKRIARAKREALKRQAQRARAVGVPFWVLAEACLHSLKGSTMRILVEDWAKEQMGFLGSSQKDNLTYPELQKLLHFSYPICYTDEAKGEQQS